MTTKTVPPVTINDAIIEAVENNNVSSLKILLQQDGIDPGLINRVDNRIFYEDKMTGVNFYIYDGLLQKAVTKNNAPELVELLFEKFPRTSQTTLKWAIVYAKDNKDVLKLLFQHKNFTSSLLYYSKRGGYAPDFYNKLFDPFRNDEETIKFILENIEDADYDYVKECIYRITFCGDPSKLELFLNHKSVNENTINTPSCIFLETLVDVARSRRNDKDKDKVIEMLKNKGLKFPETVSVLKKENYSPVKIEQKESNIKTICKKEQTFDTFFTIQGKESNNDLVEEIKKVSKDLINDITLIYHHLHHKQEMYDALKILKNKTYVNFDNLSLFASSVTSNLTVAELAELKKYVIVLEHEKKVLADENKKLTEDNQHLKGTYNSLNHEISLYKQEVQRYLTQIQTLEKVSRKKNDILSGRSVDLQFKSGIITKLEDENKKLKQDWFESNKIIIQQKDEINKLKGEKKCLKEFIDLDVKEQKISDGEIKFYRQKLDDVIKQRDDSIKQREHAFDIAIKQRDDALNENADLKKKIEKYNSANRSLIEETMKLNSPDGESLFGSDDEW